MSTQSTDSAEPTSSKHLNRQVGQYALAAAVAGVSVLALAQPAQGEVVITKKTIPIPFFTGAAIDINHDGATDFRFNISYYSFSGTSLRVEGGGVVGTFYASALVRGAKVGPSAHFSSSTFERIERGTGGYLNHKFHGKWASAKDRYLGVRFLINGKTHYGWVRLTVTIPSNPRDLMTGTITAYAYETVPNKPIQAGLPPKAATSDAIAPSRAEQPKEPSLGMLALGVDGFSLWRREETLTSS